MDEITRTGPTTPRDREERRRRVRRGLLAGVVASSLGLTVACGAVESGTASGSTSSTGTTGTTGTSSSGTSSSDTSSWSSGSGVSSSSTSTDSSHASSGGS